jgi:hypothetical protein
MVNNLKGGIPKIWGETLLLLLLGIDIDRGVDNFKSDFFCQNISTWVLVLKISLILIYW